jgi:hypothetical protein
VGCAAALRLPEYGSAYSSVLGTDIRLVVMSFKESVATWARELLRERAPTMHSCVVTPGNVPRSGPIDPQLEPERALAEAMLHVRGRDSLGLLTNALRALRNFSGNELLIYEEMLPSRIDRRLIMEAHEQLDLEDGVPQWIDDEISPTGRRSYLFVRGQEDGLAEGRARAVLDLLRDRGLDPDPATEATILACRDSNLLRAWLVRAATITRLDALFE